MKWLGVLTLPSDHIVPLSKIFASFWYCFNTLCLSIYFSTRNGLISFLSLINGCKAFKTQPVFFPWNHLNLPEIPLGVPFSALSQHFCIALHLHLSSPRFCRYVSFTSPLACEFLKNNNHVLFSLAFSMVSVSGWETICPVDREM